MDTLALAMALPLAAVPETTALGAGGGAGGALSPPPHAVNAAAAANEMAVADENSVLGFDFI
jgi:hypothetical protein